MILLLSFELLVLAPCVVILSAGKLRRQFKEVQKIIGIFLHKFCFETGDNCYSICMNQRIAHGAERKALQGFIECLTNEREIGRDEGIES